MRAFKVIAFAALFTAAFVVVNAQAPASPLNTPDYNKAKIFSDLPEKLMLNLPNMEALLALPIGAAVNTEAADGLLLTGSVVSKSNPADAIVKSVVIKSRNRPGAVLTFTRITGTDGSFSYIGRMLSKDAGDALQILKENGHYIIHKQSLYELMSE